MGMNYLDSSGRSERARNVDLTAIYLREMGATPLLDREQEVELTSAIARARKDFARAVAKLPAACRKQALDGLDKPPAGKLWKSNEDAVMGEM